MNSHSRLNQYTEKQDVIQALRRIRFVGGRTNTFEALKLATREIFNPNNGDRQDAGNFAIVFTDGKEY